MKNISKKIHAYKVNSKNSIFEFIIIYAILFTASYQGFLGEKNSFFDEILILALIIVELFKYVKGQVPIKKDIKLIIIYFLLSIVALCLRKYNPIIYVREVMNNIKPMIILVVFRMAHIDNIARRKIFKFFVFMNIPSMITAIVQFNNKELGYEIGMVRDGVARVEGLAGHPITFAYIMLLVVLALYEIGKDKGAIGKLLCIITQGIAIFLLVSSKSRFPLLLLIVPIFIIFIWNKSIYSKTLIGLMISIICIILLSKYHTDIMAYLKDDFDNTVRMYGIMMTPKILLVYPLLGTGIGTCGTTSSLIYDSYVYNKFNFKDFSYMGVNGGNLFESGLAQKLIENGVLGTVIVYVFFIRYLRILRVGKDKIGYSMIIIFILNSVLNTIYLIPIFIFMSICISNSSDKTLKLQ